MVKGVGEQEEAWAGGLGVGKSFSKTVQKRYRLQNSPQVVVTPSRQHHGRAGYNPRSMPSM